MNSPFNNTTNNTTKVFKKGIQKMRSLSILKWVFIVLFLIIFAVIIYFIIKKIKENIDGAVTILKGPISASDTSYSSKTFSIPTLTKGLAFTYSSWIYVDGYNYRNSETKNILVHSGVSNSPSPSIDLQGGVNNLTVSMATTSGTVETCEIYNIPLQKWIHVLYVLNNRTADIYINGKLEKSCVFESIPRVSPGVVKILQEGANGNAGYAGKLSNIKYFGYAINQDLINKLYDEGPYAQSNYSLNFFNDGSFVKMKADVSNYIDS